ncbi:Uncharacterized protein family UPF0126 [Desulfotomaculum nigrificans CO-1-SRB]|uniref:Uncharacterized protein family UPF0126 n=1 Tax=Desulfotomaculum nigrificans (strain DSM 14880 / VKM B-2319 / CO-1-SRB) TaxID=868595 RepID=F6B555_DESCC|nr:trimeric intracellular cation channel family protein [Desulfotomaculum nigrificans]AEF93074.1 Uncharacterized protein family UPF0126 [Desulfotomaculum nigrificans CO-1-SRB]
MTVLYFFDLFGTFAFAVSGALIAIKKEMDLFGVMVLALVTAIGGGTTRDLLLGNTPVFALTEPVYIYVSLSAAILTFLFANAFFRIHSVIMIADALGLGTFVCIGVSRGLAANISLTGAVILGVITGVVGGIIRDMLAGEVPTVLTKHFYAMTCVAGGILYITLYRLNVNHNTVMLVTAGFIIVLRLLAIKFRWHFFKAKQTKALPDR